MTWTGRAHGCRDGGEYCVTNIVIETQTSVNHLQQIVYVCGNLDMTRVAFNNQPHSLALSLAVEYFYVLTHMLISTGKRLIFLIQNICNRALSNQGQME